MAKRRVIVDTDLSLGALGSEIDDGLALAMVVAEPGFDLQAVTTVSGNVDAKSAAQLVLDLFGRWDVSGVPVFTGATSPLCDPRGRRPVAPSAPNVEGVAQGYAAAQLARLVMEAPGEITVIALGPLTNIAVAINLEPGFATAVKEIVVMGGTYFRNLSWGSLPGEFNFWLDPEAAQAVLRSGAAVRLVGLDVTTQIQLSRADALRLAGSDGDFAPHIGEHAVAWIDRLAREYPEDPLVGDSCSLHDALAVAATARPDLLDWRDISVQIITDDQAGRGVAVLDRIQTPNCSIAVGVRADAVRGYIFGLLDGL
ncbi:hypothetical protein BVC93_13730 [Mycobacterium sp. MS1601]|uniref:nucleoside hydrolase n=1 Tax=Mycobacterium sp. MS1601 TaxID=1936029 RepID=UPI000979184E|nr:nucleoside hydrolase [Mycobacterium sp. MS1601]AQA03299.1 hypothetical protein BVC93_13730 [Mycobacterium sp. MS1601]